MKNNTETFHDSYEKIGERLHLQRSLHNLTQEKVAEAINVTTKYYGLVERGERALSLSVADQLCQLYGVTYDYLYLGLERTHPSCLSEESSQEPTARSALMNLVLSCSDKECESYLQLFLAVNRLRALPRQPEKASDSPEHIGSDGCSSN